MDADFSIVFLAASVEEADIIVAWLADQIVGRVARAAGESECDRVTVMV